MEKSEAILQDLKKANVILEGHFKLSSGLHSEQYVQCAKIFEEPLLSMKVIELLAEKVLKSFKRSEFDKILSPAMGGILCGYELARQLLCKNIFVERVEGAFTLRRGFEIKPGERILLVEDVVTTGKSSLEAIRLAESMGAKVIGVASVIDRRDPNKIEEGFNFPVISVLKMDIKTYKPEELPSHLASTPWEKPGSRKS